MLRVKANDLEGFCAALFRAAGVPVPGAGLVARGLDGRRWALIGVFTTKLA